MHLDHPTLIRHNVRVAGNGTQPMLLVHGYGCNQVMWRDMIPHFANDFRIYLFDHVGTVETGRQGWDAKAYLALSRYAEDVAEVIRVLDLRDVILVGHSVSAMICGLAGVMVHERIAGLVMIAPSPRYLNDEGYVGGFERADVDGLIEAIEGNYLGWAEGMAPAIMGRPDAPTYGEELTARFCEQDPEVGLVFAKATFLSDHRADLASFTFPTLVLQCQDDVIAPLGVGRYVADRLPQGTLHSMKARGHCPNLSAPEETSAAIRAWLEEVYV